MESYKKKWKDYLLLHFILFFYSLSSVCAKFASNESFGSKKFIIFYGVSLGILFIYAIVWQQLLKKFPLTTAYSNKAITIIWGLFWGYFIFNENLSLKKVIGAFIVIIGIFILSSEKVERKTLSATEFKSAKADMGYKNE